MDTPIYRGVSNHYFVLSGLLYFLFGLTNIAVSSRGWWRSASPAASTKCCWDIRVSPSSWHVDKNYSDFQNFHMQNEWYKFWCAISPLKIPLNNSTSHSALLPPFLKLLFVWVSIVFFPIYRSLSLTTKRATAQDLTSIENIKSPQKTPTYFHKIKD